MLITSISEMGIVFRIIGMELAIEKGLGSLNLFLETY